MTGATGFVSYPLLTPFPRAGVWLVREPAVVHLEHEWLTNETCSLLIPAPFWTDLASVPNTAWPALDCGPTQLARAGLVHDYTVRRGARLLSCSGSPIPITFDMSLLCMDAVMRNDGISDRDRWIVVSALKIARPFYWLRKEVGWRPEEGLL